MDSAWEHLYSMSCLKSFLISKRVHAPGADPYGMGSPPFFYKQKNVL